MTKFIIISISALMLGVAVFLIFDKSEMSNESTNTQVSVGQTVFIDPSSGQVTDTPSDADISAMNQMLKQKKVIPEEVFRGEQGMVGVKLNGRFHKTLVATIDDSGNVKVGHAEESHLTTTTEQAQENSLKTK